jgi:spore coat protein CotH
MAIYDPETIPKFELTLDAAAIAVLSNPDVATEDTWVHGSFKMGDTTFADVGVRRKGQATFRALPRKAALKVKFNKWVKGQKLNGLSDITLNNMAGDPTFVAERLTYHVFRSLGLPAPMANTAQLTINGEDYGIYANVETPDDQFITRVFGAKAKTLYEVGTGGGWLPGEESGLQIDVADPAAPVGALPDIDLLFQAVASANNATLIEGIQAHLQTTEWLRHSAAEAVTGHCDGYAYGLWGSRNYFMAGDTDGKLSLIPWSTDLALSDREGVLSAAVPRTDIVLERCRLGGTCWDAYKVQVQSVLDVYRTLDLVNLAKKWHAQIDALATADPKRETAIDYYQQQTDLLYTWLDTRPSVIKAQLGL